MSPFARDGHLHPLGIEQLVAGELSEEEVATHLASCKTRSRLEIVRPESPSRAPISA